MKLLALTLLPLFILTACQNSEPPAGIQDVSAEKAAELIASKPDLVVLDVRTPEEYAAGHIQGARVINFRDESFPAEIAKLDRDKPYLMHCASGNRSGQALVKFKELGFKNIYHLKDGFKGWQSSGQAVATGDGETAN